MDEHPNATRVRKCAEAAAAGDLKGALDPLAAHLVHRVAGRNLLTGTYHGPQAMHGLLVRMAELTDGTIRMTVDDVVGTDGYGVLFATITAERGGKHLDTHGVQVFKVDDEGKFCESWFLHNDQRALDDFFS